MKIIKTILKAALFVLLLWGLIHFLAVFGLLIAFGFVLLWLVIPNNIPCISCRLKRQGNYCNLCRQTVDKKNISPKNFSSAIFNGLLILAFTLLSIGMVFLERNILRTLEPVSPSATFTIPQEKQYEVGDVFPVIIEVTGVEYPINAIQADLGFDPEAVEVLDVSVDESFATIFIQKKINNDEGYVRLTGGLPSPGYEMESGIFGTVYFRALSPGPIKIEYLPSSLVLANDGQGTNVLSEIGSISHLIVSDKLLTDENMDKSQVVGEKDVLGEKSGTKLELFDKGEVFETREVLLGQEVGEAPIIPSQKLQNAGIDAVLDFIIRLNTITISVWGL